MQLQKHRKKTIMNKPTKFMLVALLSMATLVVLATPSTQIWIPSTDIQPFEVLHLGIDEYWRASDHGYFENGKRDPNVYDIGPTIGVLPFNDVQMEVGLDYISTFSGSKYDDHPVYFNAKIGMPEGVLCSNAPALAIGGYNFGTKAHDATRTDQNIIYGLVAETVPAFCGLPSLGRFSAGYYISNKDVLVDRNGRRANEGVLLSWDRTMSEISDRLWLAVDYMGGDNSLGALSFGVAWKFTPRVSMILGYDMYADRALAGANTITTQLDIDF